MSDDLTKLERQLEQATSRSAPSGQPLDPETAPLREAWLAFGQLLEAAHPAADQAVVQPGSRSARRRRLWLVPAAVGLAASLLVAVTIAWMLHGGGDSSDSSSASLPAGIAANQAGPPSAAKAQQRPTAAFAAELAWDDTLDKQIVLAGEAVLNAEEDWSVLADAANSVHYGIRQMEKDVQGSPL